MKWYKARVEVDQAACHIHARHRGHVERTIVTAEIAAKTEVYFQKRATSTLEIRRSPATGEGVALHEAVGVERQQLHALRQDQLARAAWARTVFP